MQWVKTTIFVKLNIKKKILVGMFTVSFLWQAYEYINAPTMEDDDELYLNDDSIS